MTQEQKRIKIAETQGWTGPFGQGCAEGMELEGGDLYGFIGTDPEGDRYPVPDYFNDLNAMKTAEDLLSNSAFYGEPDTQGFYKVLSGMVGYGRLVSASAALRAEAFGRTLGLWKEGE